MNNYYDPDYYDHKDAPSYGQIIEPYGPNPPRCPYFYPSPAQPNTNLDSYYNNPPYIPQPNNCNCVAPDRFPVSNIINVESKLILSLQIKLYSVTEEDDVTIVLENNKKYKITYLTESGVKEITAILKYIDYNIPTDCVRYIGEYNNVTNQAYIIVDASTEGNSDIRKIFIKSLRGIEEIVESSNINNDEVDKDEEIILEGIETV